MIAQRHRFCRANRFTLFRFIIAQHIRAQITLFGSGSGRFVVGNPVSRYQQRRHGINKGRFSRADISGQQSVLTTELKWPDLAVKSTPVEYLQTFQAKSCQGIIADEVQIKQLLHFTPPDSSTAPDIRQGAYRIQPATAHRQMI